MIRIHGSPSTAEYSAAERLCDRIKEWDPDAHTNGIKRVEILVGEKLPGAPPVEVDLILLMWRVGKAKFPLVESQKGNAILESLILTIEVKDVDDSRIRFRGANAQVMYDGSWDEITPQLHKQPHALKRYLRTRGRGCAPYVAAVGWLSSLRQDSIPYVCTQCVGGNAAFGDLLRVAILEGTPVEKGIEGWMIRSMPGDAAREMADLADLFVGEVRPSRLDRRRVEAISKKWLDGQQYAADLGKKMLLIRGAAGTGKTIALLRMARDLIRNRDARIVFLTYNNALITELRRLIGHNPDLFGISNGGDRVTFITVDTFIRRLGDALACDSVRATYASYPEKHSAIKNELLTLLEGDSQPYVDEIRLSEPTLFASDFVMVDEGQDWPHDECLILRKLVGYQRLVVATSPSQLQRGTHPTDWTAGLGRASYNLTTFKKVRRLSEGLFRFARAFLKASGGDDDEEVSPDPDVTGGDIHIVAGDYFSQRALHDQLLVGLKEDENAPIDMLFVVPPGDGGAGKHGKHESFAARSLTEWGHEVWDGTRSDVKRSAPDSVEQVRVINYRSVRGLEGWTVALLGFDKYYEWLLQHPEGVPVQKDLLADPAVLAKYAAAQQLAIPMTRAVKNLVIEVRDEASPVAQWLKDLHKGHPELCTWHMAEAYSGVH